MAQDKKEDRDAGTQLLDDRKLIEACLNGDSPSWELLIERYQRLIYSIPIRIGFSPIDAADIFQAVCLKLLKRLAGIRDYEKLSSWLITTTTRECWRAIEKQKRETQPSIYDEEYRQDVIDRLAAAEPLAEELRIRYERQQTVREAIAVLSEKCRALITLLFYQKDEYTYQEIASRLKIPLNSLGPTRARCLQKLRKLLEGRI
jgi:RNA polymerase sigma factor (sigma-70 family)